MLNKLDKFHHTKTGYLTFGLIELAGSYVLVGLAIDRGNLLYYLLTLVLLVGALRNFLKLIGKLFNATRNKKRSR